MNTILKICKKHGELTKDNVAMEEMPSGRIGFRCVFCKREKDARWKNNNRDKHRRTANSFRDANREVFNAQSRIRRKINPEPYRRRAATYRKMHPDRSLMNVLRQRKLSREKYDQMLLEQDNKCFICRKSETRKSCVKGKINRLVIDHDHEMNEVRALLCHACNVGIGSFKEDIEIMNKAIEYLMKYRRE